MTKTKTFIVHYITEKGKRLIPVLSEERKKEFGKSYSERNLHYFRKFYLYFPDEKIVNACVII